VNTFIRSNKIIKNVSYTLGNEIVQFLNPLVNGLVAGFEIGYNGSVKKKCSAS
jgi:hypothetical protein